MNAGLSPGTVHNIINRQFQPTVFSLNRLADYLGVKRQYLWQLAGILEDMDYDQRTTFCDPRLRSCSPAPLGQTGRDALLHGRPA